MSSEDRQRTIDFILEQQAQFATNIQLLRETQTQLTISQAKADVRMDRIEEVVIRTVDVVERLADGLNRTEGLVAAVTEAQAQTDASLRELAASQAQTEATLRGLAEAGARLAGGQEHTDQRLNTLINVVERYISKGAEGDSA
jgi:uncharacterized phage infection (PIP) family protein YhgE